MNVMQGLVGRQTTAVTALLFGTAIVVAFLVVPVAPGGAASATATLDDDAGGLALFSGSPALSPGVTRTACLSLAATATNAPDLVTMTANQVSGALAPHVIVDIDLGTGGVYGDCSAFVPTSAVFSGTLADLAATPGDGVPTGWRPAALPVASFRIAVTADSAARPNGSTAQADFVWRLVAGPVAPPTPRPTPSEPTPTTPSTPTPTTPPSPTPTTPSDPTPTGPSDGPATPTVPPVPEPRPSTAPAVTPTPVSTSPSPSPPAPTPTSTTGVAPSPGGTGGGGPTGETPGPDLTLTPPLAQRAWTTALAALQKPQFTLGPLLVALAFLLLQQWIDLRDPKLARAARTRREMLLDFHVDYRALAEERP